jgi:hypothetical protein
MSPSSSGSFPNIILVAHVAKLSVDFDGDGGLATWLSIQSYLIRAFSLFDFLFAPLFYADNGEFNFLVVVVSNS